MTEKLFRSADGALKPMLNAVEGISFQESPLDFFILLARYKFAARLLDRSDSVLDAGCGHGLGSVMLSKFARQVTGVDADRELVDHARQAYSAGNLEFAVADIRKLSTLRRTFDSVVCLDVIEHFPEDEGPLVVESLLGALNDRGMAIIGTPNRRSNEFASTRRKLSHPYEYDYASMKALLSPRFRRAMIFSMTDEVVSTGFSEMAWYFMAVCVR